MRAIALKCRKTLHGGLVRSTELRATGARFLPSQHAEMRRSILVFAQRGISPVKWLVDPRKLAVA
jgi:hypothetical protein